MFDLLSFDNLCMQVHLKGARNFEMNLVVVAALAVEEGSGCKCPGLVASHPVAEARAPGCSGLVVAPEE